MRRIVTLLLVALAAPLAGIALLLQAGPAMVARTMLGAADLVTPSAVAQTTLEFKQVPPESVSELDRVQDRARRASSRDSLATPPVPQIPVPPVPPVTRAGDLARFGNDIRVESGEIVRGDITAMGGTVTVDGTVHGDIAAIGGDVYLNSTARVEGDVVSVGGAVHEQPGAYVSGRTMTVAGGSWFGRQARRGWRDRDWGAEARHEVGWGMLRVVKAFVGLVFAMLFTLLVVWLFPSRIVSGVEVARRHPATSLGIGALVYALLVPSVIALAIVVALLCITIIGIPLALAAVLGYCLFFVVFALFGLTIANTLVGDWIARKRGVAGLPLWQTALAGTLLLGGARLVGRFFQVVPGIGWLGSVLIAFTVLTVIVLGTIGGGAWLKWELGEGLFGRWRGRWESRRQPAVPPSYGPPAGSPYGPPAAPEPPAPPPPPASAPGAFMPPTPEPPSPPPTPGT